MIPFLEEIADRISKDKSVSELTIVFPNRRAALFFRSYLSRKITTPIWSPRLITIEELFKELSDLQEADRLSLIFTLYRVYLDVINSDESFDRFYFWGDMLLRDFDEVDKYMAPASQLFRDLSAWRELDDTFDALTDDQKQFLRDFWISFGDKPASSREEFLKVWRKLPDVYAKFNKQLRKAGIGYEGMIHRDVAAKLGPARSATASADMIFAGFNALTTAEELLIAHYVEEGARVYWDMDPWYVDNKHQEAGQFFRQYKRHKILGRTFADNATESNFNRPGKQVDLYGLPQKSGQAKLAGQLITEQIIPTLKSSGGTEDEVRTVIVLPDESMLLSVLHSIPDELKSINVTMGYPLKQTPLYNLLELLVEVQISRRDAGFSHRQINGILGHPYILALDEVNAKRIHRDIVDKNRVFVDVAELNIDAPLLAPFFRIVSGAEITTYLLEIIRLLGSTFSDDQSFDREYAFQFHNILARFTDVLKDSSSVLDLKGFQKLFRQVIQSHKIPFTGEPLKGLQIMGVLETRNLDFDNVFILSLNEGSLPAAPRQGSYIPHAIRKAYSLPTNDHQDAMYAYLFYRLLQRAKNIRMFYITEPDILGMGEMSRFVQQLLYESEWKINHHILSNPISLTETQPIVVAKTPAVIDLLRKYEGADGRGISPSALTDYIECTLRFYLKHLARLREADEVEESLDARVFGNFLHDIMFWFYDDLKKAKGSGVVEQADLEGPALEPRLEALVDRAFHKHYNLADDKKIEYIGQRIVVKEIVLQFVRQILERDHAHAPFAIELLEVEDFKSSITINASTNPKQVFIGGRIDRVDSKSGSARIIDYKTGKDVANFEGIASLFRGEEGKSTKGPFQTILYAWLYKKNYNFNGPIQPMLMNRKNIFSDKDSLALIMNRIELLDVTPALPEFEAHLIALLETLYNPEIPFVQTTNEVHCKFCPFKEMCRR